MNYIDKIRRAKQGEAMILNPAPHAGYAAIDPSGDIVAVTDTRQAAMNALSGEVWVDDEDFPDDEPVQNPPAGDNPRRALQVAGLEPLDFDEVMNISLDDAHRALYPYFALLHRKGKVIKAYQSVEGMVEQFLGQNDKTAKTIPGHPSMVMGLTLMPSDRLTATYDELDPKGEIHVAVNKLLRRPDKFVSIAAVHEGLSQEKRRKQWTMCAGSNNECRNSCLAYVARNVDPYNVRRKAVGTMALIEQPQYFVRMLAEAIKIHSRSEVCRGLKPYVRLNVLSDVPWELFVPGMFDYFENFAMPGFSPVTFYDYTKLANRKPPKNYDLTFSFSGTNEALARSEIALGRRVAVVFLAMKPKGRRERWVPFRYTGESTGASRTGHHRPQADLPETFWDLPVVDGDVHDVRPLNEPPCIVGLRWKAPAHAAKRGIDPRSSSFSFVTRVFHVSGETFYDEPAAQSLRHGEQEYIATPVTPRYQPISVDDET